MIINLIIQNALSLALEILFSPWNLILSIPHSKDTGPLLESTTLVRGQCRNEAKALDLLKPISMLCSILYFLVIPRQKSAIFTNELNFHILT